jgi:hypothetical protein
VPALQPQQQLAEQPAAVHLSDESSSWWRKTKTARSKRRGGSEPGKYAVARGGFEFILTKDNVVGVQFAYLPHLQLTDKFPRRARGIDFDFGNDTIFFHFDSHDISDCICALLWY